MLKPLLHLVKALLLSSILTAVYALTAHAQTFSPRMQFLLKTKITHHGPNCWNSALVVSGVLPHFRYTSPKEFMYLMDSPACEKITPGSQMKGDIQVYLRTIPGLSEEQRQVHANIWLDERVAFNKKTDFSTAPYEIAHHQAVNADYGRTPEIFKFTLEDGKNTQVSCSAETCENLIEYRRCKNIEGLKRQDPHYSLEIEYFINVLGISIQHQVRNPSKATDSWRARAQALLLRLNASIIRECGADTSFYCESSRNAYDSLLWQVQRPQPSWLK